MTDHTRGCQGREYTCTCGYDDERDTEIDRLRSALSEAEKERDHVQGLGIETINLWKARAEKAEAERYALAMAICGGEDAPGYLDSVSVEAIVGVHKHNCQWQIGRAEKAEAELAQARNALKPFAEVAQCVLAEAPPEATMWSAYTDCEGNTSMISLGYLRRAAALLTDTGRTEGEQK